MSVAVALQEVKDRLQIAEENHARTSLALDEVAASLVFLEEAMKAEEQDRKTGD